MTQEGPEHYREYANEAGRIASLAASNREELLALYSPELDKDDARAAALSKFINSVNSLTLGFVFVSESLLNRTWWHNRQEELSDGDLAILVKEFRSFLRMGAVQSIFSCAESSIRVLLRAIDAKAEKRSLGPFKRVYGDFFSLLEEDHADTGILLDLVRHIRNTIHNNGVFFDPGLTDRDVTWRGRRYQFCHGATIDFVGWDLVLKVADAMREALLRICSDPKVCSVDHKIDDPFRSS